MPIAHVNGVNLVYEVIGDSGPWIALTPGGRRAHKELVSLGRKLAAAGFRVLLHDRRNTGASDIVIDGDVGEESLWVDDLHELLTQRGALPAFIGGSSAGARMSIRYCLRYPQGVRALMLLRVTGGPFAAGRLPENYYGQFIRAAETGGMSAVCATEQYKERIAANPSNLGRLMAMDPKHYIAIMSRWRDQFCAGCDLPVMGVTEADLRSIKIPTVVIPGNDKTHSSASGRAAAKLIPSCRLHELPIEDQDVDLITFDQWAPYEDEIARVFVDVMRSAELRRAS